MIRAFRDTWELGIHSYLTYVRDRLLLARVADAVRRDRSRHRGDARSARGLTASIPGFRSHPPQKNR